VQNHVNHRARGLNLTLHLLSNGVHFFAQPLPLTSHVFVHNMPLQHVVPFYGEVVRYDLGLVARRGAIS
jgi:hypothetical protein